MSNAQIQKSNKHKYTNTAYGKVPERPNMWYIFEKRIVQGYENDTHDDDDISKLQPKASLTFEFIKTSASTFNPTGSLSSTEDNVHKNKRSKLQKVKVKRQTGVQQSRLQFLASC